MCKILAIDDNSNMLTYYRKAITKLNHTLETASSGKSGLEKIRNNNYDLVLLDLQMLPMNGLETLKRIRRTNKNIPVIIVTADDSEVSNAIKMGANDYYVKPFTMNKLEDVINKYSSKIQFAC